MFVKPSGMKKLMKAAFAGAGLRIGKKDGTVYIGGSWWELDTKEEYIPKEILAVIVELTGCLPQEGEAFKATEAGNQMEAFTTVTVDTEGYEHKALITDFMVAYGKGKNGYRILQDEKTGEFYLLNNWIFEILDKKSVENEKREEAYSGPILHPDRGVIFENNVMRFRVCYVNMESALETLKEVKEKGIRLAEKGERK